MDSLAYTNSDTLINLVGVLTIFVTLTFFFYFESKRYKRQYRKALIEQRNKNLSSKMKRAS